jgi:uncharacterized membrane protein YfcA
MEHTPMDIAGLINPLYVLSGLVVGFVVGLTGVGGGSLMTPILVLLFGVHPVTAVGTDLLYASATKAVGTAMHRVGDTIDWGVAGLLASGSIPATALTLFVLRKLGVEGGDGLITTILGAALVVTALAVMCRRWIVTYAARIRGKDDPRRTRALTIVTGAVLGALVSATSVGAGALGVTALIILYPGFSTARIVGTDIAHAVPLTLVAGLGHWLIGSVDILIIVSLLHGSLPGVVAGSFLAPRVPDGALRPILAIVLAVVGVRLLFR